MQHKNACFKVILIHTHTTFKTLLDNPSLLPAPCITQQLLSLVAVRGLLQVRIFSNSSNEPLLLLLLLLLLWLSVSPLVLSCCFLAAAH